jgi:hypothetical protein
MFEQPAGLCEESVFTRLTKMQVVIARLLLCLSVLTGAIGVLFVSLTVNRSMLPYNSEGNYFDGVVVYHEQSVLGYGLCACVAAIVTLALAWMSRWLRRSMGG